MDVQGDTRWGDDAVYDLVGNLDEWVDEPGGAFAGGFYSRSTRAGCEAVVTAHPKGYLDYSTGVRCCYGGGEQTAAAATTHSPEQPGEGERRDGEGGEHLG